MKKIYIIFIFISSLVSAQNMKLFEQANSLYQKGNYKEAINLYDSILTTGEHSSELYYNLGNCYFKLNKVAPSIYNYEKAIQLNKDNENAKNNLVLANLLKIDRIKPTTSLWTNINDFLQKLSFESWGVLAIIFSFIAVLFFVFYYLSISSSKKRLFFASSLFSFMLMICFYGIAFQQHNNLKNSKFAIVFSKKVSVQAEPVKNSSSSFIIHEGTKVKITDTVENWKEIKLADGKSGWILSENIKEL